MTSSRWGMRCSGWAGISVFETRIPRINTDFKPTAKPMQQLLSLLEGKKTYIVALLAAGYIFGGTLNWWPVDERILTLLGFGGLASLRSAVKKVE